MPTGVSTLGRRSDSLVVHEETREPLGNVKEIAAVDLGYLWTANLSTALRYAGRITHPEVPADKEWAGTTILEIGKAACTLVNNIGAYKHWGEPEFQYLCTGFPVLNSQAARARLQALRG